MNKLSRTSKLDGILSWSLEALKTCPGSIADDGSLVDACRGCYATTGNYRFPNVRAVREDNRQAWKAETWVFDMIHALQGQDYFRWFDSGDMYSLELAEKILAVMRSTPGTKHWIPTRMHKFAKFTSVLASMEALPNVVVRRSSDSIHGEFSKGLHGSTIVHSIESAPDAVKVCMAYEHGGRCNGCRACWDKSVSVIGYVAHGKPMIKLIKAA
jgi:hypothetical protein